MHKGVDLLTKIFTRINQYIFIYFFFLITHTNILYADGICKIAQTYWKMPVFPQFLFGFIIKNHSMNFYFLDKIKLSEYTWY